MNAESEGPNQLDRVPKEVLPQFTLAPNFQERLMLEREIQEHYRGLRGSWLHESGEYRYPIRSIETQFMAQQEKDMQEAKQRGELSQVEQMVKDKVLSAISQRGCAVIVDYGAGRAESLRKIMLSLGEDQERVVAIATSLNQESNVDGVNFVEGDIDALYAMQSITLKDGRTVSIEGAVDVILANHSVQHSFVADAVLPLLGQLVQPNGLVILGHNKQGLLPAIPATHMGSVDQEIVGARDQAWYLGLNNLRGLGFQLVMHPADSPSAYNYLVYSRDPSVKLPEIKHL